MPKRITSKYKINWVQRELEFYCLVRQFTEYLTLVQALGEKYKYRSTVESPEEPIVSPTDLLDQGSKIELHACKII